MGVSNARNVKHTRIYSLTLPGVRGQRAAPCVVAYQTSPARQCSTNSWRNTAKWLEHNRIDLSRGDSGAG